MSRKLILITVAYVIVQGALRPLYRQHGTYDFLQPYMHWASQRAPTVNCREIHYFLQQIANKEKQHIPNATREADTPPT